MNWREEINKQLQGISPVIIRQMNIDALPRVMHYFDINKDRCCECNSFYSSLSEKIKSFSDIVNDHDSMKETEKLLSCAEKHVKEDHKVYFKGYWTALSVFFSLSIGGVIAFVYKQQGQELQSVLLGASIGMVFGYLIGKVIEYFLFKNKRLL